MHLTQDQEETKSRKRASRDRRGWGRRGIQEKRKIVLCGRKFLKRKVSKGDHSGSGRWGEGEKQPVTRKDLKNSVRRRYVSWGGGGGGGDRRLNPHLLEKLMSGGKKDKIPRKINLRLVRRRRKK